jgi:hypothetical protein
MPFVHRAGEIDSIVCEGVLDLIAENVYLGFGGGVGFH